MYIVTKTHNFDAETEATVFENYDDAVAYLRWYWKAYYQEEIACESTLVEFECYCDNDFAKVEWADGCQTWFNLIETVPPHEEFYNFIC